MGAVPPSSVHCRRRVSSAKTANRSFLFPKEVRIARAPYISRRDRASCSGPSAAVPRCAAQIRLVAIGQLLSVPRYRRKETNVGYREELVLVARDPLWRK